MIKVNLKVDAWCKEVNIRGFHNSETLIAALGVDLINQYRS